jgi:hypothetical protein
MISGISPTGPTIINRLYMINDLTRKISVPVRRFFSPSIALKHLIGIPTSNDLEGIPLYKLRILDNLIERLARLKKENNTGITGEVISADNIDTHISRLSSQVKNAYNRITPFPRNLAGSSISVSDQIKKEFPFNSLSIVVSGP